MTPIPKDTDYEQVSNNRLISLLPIVLKVCERVVYNQFASYLTSEGRLQTIKVETRNSIEPGFSLTCKYASEVGCLAEKEKRTGVVL